MKTFFKSFTSVLFVLLLVAFFSSCGKKEASMDSKTTDSKDTKTTTSSGSADTDKMIDDYDKIMKEYVAIVQAVKKGDATQTAKMQELSTKTQEWSKKLAEIAPKLTPEQSQRIANISKESADAMSK
ncbi:MAG: hypothetical protein ABI462_13330 [Ignavibacteria bacterium]